MNVNDNALHEHANSREPGARQQAASDELRVARERLQAEIEGAFSAFKRSLFVERKVLGLVVFDTAYRAACYGALALAGLVIVLAATVLLLIGLRNGIQLWTGGAWWGDLALALVLLASMGAGAHAVRRSVHRSTLATTRRVLSESATAKGSPAQDPAA